jgi:hypothetical protein
LQFDYDHNVKTKRSNQHNLYGNAPPQSLKWRLIKASDTAFAISPVRCSMTPTLSWRSIFSSIGRPVPMAEPGILPGLQTSHPHRTRQADGIDASRTGTLEDRKRNPRLRVINPILLLVAFSFTALQFCKTAFRKGTLISSIQLMRHF